MVELVQSAEHVMTSAYRELIEYLANLVSPEQILAFKVSSSIQEQLEELLDKNNEGELTPEERSKLDEIVEFDRMMFVLMARAEARLKKTL